MSAIVKLSIKEAADVASLHPYVTQKVRVESSPAKIGAVQFKFGGQFSGILYHIVTRKQIRIFYPDRPPAADYVVQSAEACDLAAGIAGEFPRKEIVLNRVQNRRPKRPKA